MPPITYMLKPGLVLPSMSAEPWVMRQMMEDRWQRTENRRQRTDDRKQKTENLDFGSTPRVLGGCGFRN